MATERHPAAAGTRPWNRMKRARLFIYASLGRVRALVGSRTVASRVLHPLNHTHAPSGSMEVEVEVVLYMASIFALLNK